MTRKRQAMIHIHSRAGLDGWDTATYILLNKKRVALVGTKENDGIEHWYEVPEGSQVQCGGGFVAVWDGVYWHTNASLTDEEVRRVPSFNSKDYHIIEGKPW